MRWNTKPSTRMTPSSIIFLEFLATDGAYYHRKAVRFVCNLVGWGMGSCIGLFGTLL
jgi:hypothetical protein